MLLLCEVRCTKAPILNRAESKTHTAYIIEEHIVRRKVVLKHEITLVSTFQSLGKSSADSVQAEESGGASCRFITPKYSTSVPNKIVIHLNVLSE